jgi:hypothetical protein
VEPFSLAFLAIAFLKAAVAGAGGAIGKAAGDRVSQALFPAVQGTGQEVALGAVASGTAPPAVEQELQQQVTSRVSQDPAYGQQLQASLNHALREAPGIADLLPTAVQQLFGLSDEQTVAQRGKCPVGGELLFLPSYFDGQGNALSRAPLGGFFSFPRSAWAQCRRGHRWPVFAVGGRPQGGLLGRLIGR